MFTTKTVNYGHTVTDINCCQRCHRKTKLLQVKFNKTLGFISWIRKGHYEGVLCTDCTESIYWNWQISNIIGLLGITTTPFSVFNLIGNTRRFIMLKRTFNDQSNPGFIARHGKKDNVTEISTPCRKSVYLLSLPIL